jgi:ABC-type multidrug transport system ATPase subunit
LILDESLSGLDRATRTHIISYLLAQQQRGLTILLVTHDAEAAGELSARVVRMQAGNIVACEAVVTAIP